MHPSDESGPPGRFPAWLRRVWRPAAIGAVSIVAIAAGSAFGLAVPQREAATSPESLPSTTATPTASASKTDGGTPTPSPSDQPPEPSPSLAPSVEPAPSPTSEPIGAPSNGRIAWDAPGQPGGGARDIVSANPDGTDLLYHTASEAEERNVVWSPNGQLLAYISDASGGSVEVIGPDGGLSVVHDGSFPFGTYYTDGVAWAPDSAHVALGLVPGGVQIVDLNGTVTASFGAAHPRHLAWSPSGNLLAFVDGRQLLVADTSTGSSRVVVEMSSNVRFANWTPDERTLLFHGYTESGNTDLFVVGLDGTGLRNLTATDDLFEDVPVLSPDGNLIAMVVAVDSSQRVDVMNLDGTDRRTVLMMSGFGSPAWAPDGTAIVVGHGERITVVPLDGSPSVDVGTGNAPSWGRGP